MLAVLAACTLISRLLYLGQPILNIDEQFYLLVGDRMLAGAWPYADIWDRKPPVLFAIYAGIRLLGGEGIWQSQLAALASVTATAFVIHRLALRLAPTAGALGAGVAYVWWSALCGGAIGQAGVFFNLFMALAALLLVQAMERERDGAAILPRGLAAMLLAGLSVQTKQSVVFEAAWFGLAFAVLAWRTRPPVAALGITVLAAGVALAPSLAAVALWWRAGALDALLFATVTSAGLRAPMGWNDYAWHLATSLLRVAPLVAFALAGMRMAGREDGRWGGRGPRLFLAGWLAVALLALFAYDRTFYDHYLLGLLVPATVLAAPAFAAWRRLRPAIAATALSAVVAVFALQWAERSKSGQRRTIAALATATAGQRNCPFSFGGPSVAYALNDWCLPTRYAFAGHLTFAAESPAIGVDSLAEVARILDGRPDRVIVTAAPMAKANAATRALVMRRLARDYTPAARIEPDGLVVYRLRPGLTPRPNAVGPAAKTGSGA